MKIESLIRDRYNREARLAPALLVALPAALVAFSWFPGLRALGPALVALLGFCGGIVWLSHLARDRGKRIEAQLFAAWGGMPSTAMLRHRDQRLPAPLKARYKVCLHKHLPDLFFPSAAEEDLDPQLADAVYEAAVAWLLTQTRDRKRFGLLFEENVNYGFRRNFQGMKPVALLVGIGSLLFSIGVASVGYERAGATPEIEAVVATGMVAIYVSCVACLVKRAWVRILAEAFGRQLLATCDLLSVKATRARKPRPTENGPK